MLMPIAPGRPARDADRALRDACAAEDEARKCAVLWFGEILSRRLYRDLGYSSMPQYARLALGFSETRVGDFMRLARRLDELPALREALPEIGYTKAREIVRVASPRSEAKWVDLARTSTREQLAMKVRRVKARSRRAAGAAELFVDRPVAAAASESRTDLRGNARPPVESVDVGVGLDAVDTVDAVDAADSVDTVEVAALAAEVPVRVAFDLTPEQHARWTALWERLHRRGVTGNRAEILLAALHDASGRDDATTHCAETAPRGASVPPVQIHVHSARPAAAPRSPAGNCAAATPSASTAMPPSAVRVIATPRPSRRARAARCWRAMGIAARRPAAGVRSFSRCITGGRARRAAATSRTISSRCARGAIGCGMNGSEAAARRKRGGSEAAVRRHEAL